MKFQRAFTLMELVITVAIVAILAAVAIPTFNSYLLKSHRSDAYSSLLSMQLAEERYRASNTSYGTLAQVWNGVTATEGGRYTLAVSNTSATTYTLTATAVGGQASDSEDGTSCATLTITYSAGVESKTPAACW
ncbi:MAG: type IV pilin protein [Coxiellaceae bacterium]|nr:type IV pilin protein [Coxiellaceae bacterium]